LSEGAWPADLDALRAAPGQHRLLLENERVRILDTRIAPGEGDVLWGDALGPHSLENVGNEPLHIVSVEIKPSA
jgi:hypothetical protein